MIDPERLRARVAGFRFAPSKERPRLLFGTDEVKTLRRRAEDRGVTERLDARCRRLLDTPAGVVRQMSARGQSQEAETMASAYLLTGKASYADWARERVRALLALETWKAPVHSNKHCDHVMTNVAAHLAMTHDLLGDAYSASETDGLTQGMRRLHFEPFLAGTRDRAEWWMRADCESNWKIMCCGESGLAICGFVDRWDDAPEALGIAAQGVVEILNMIPPDGDWPEGVGYWFATLWMGLRYAKALHRLTGGEIDLFQHPRLAVTGDFAMMMVSPAGRVFNFNDNRPALGAPSAEALLMLGSENGRGDWMYAARMFPADSLLYLLWDDEDVPSRVPERTVAYFPRTGVVTTRSNWGENDTFVGFKCGPSDVGHSHLDANHFVVEARGKPLIFDEGTWPYAHFLGFFDTSRLRWNWDNVAAVGHNTLLIDGRGQTYGPDRPGRVLQVESAGGWDMAVGDATLAYPETLTKFIRTILFVKPCHIVVRDVVQCRGERHAEWLLHTPGTVRSEGFVTIVENEGAWLSLTPLLPQRENGWRVTDATRTSMYQDSNTLEPVTIPISYRSFAPFRAASSFEFLFGLRVGGGTDDWRFEGSEGNWELRAKGLDVVIRPDGDALRVAH